MNITGIAEIMDKSLDILRQKFKDIVMYNLVYTMILGIVGFLLIVLFAILGIFLVSSSDEFSGVITYVSVLLTILLGLYLSLGTGVINIASKTVLGEKTSIGKSISLAFKAILKTLALTFLVALTLIPAIIIFYYMGRGFIDSFFNFINFGTFTFRLQWLIFIIIPLFMLLLAFFVAILYLIFYIYILQEMIIEKKGPIRAIKGSYRLIKNNYFTTLKNVFLVLLSVYGIRYSFESIVTLVVAIIYLAGVLFGIEQDMMTIFTGIYGVMTVPLTALTWLVITPVFFIMTTVMYYNERAKKDGIDLYMKLETLKKQRKEMAK
ncbi:hypothetical protein ACPWSR_09300 [Alloiococcus sp. CFN-8]|uniref:hypothetical protein n=1 Tax=Alloiococcus sp. CFN-8 TaxID=3416081 RepID=UPI003CFA323E